MTRIRTYFRHNWRMILNIITLAVLVLIVWAVWDDIVSTLKSLKNINYWWLLLIIPLQLLDYDAYARMYRGMFNHLGQKVSYKSMYRVSLELNFVNNAFPSGGVSGISFFGLRLKSYGVKASNATLVQLLKFVAIFVSFQILIGVALLALAIGGKTNNIILLTAGSLATLTLVGTALGAYIISSRKRIDMFFTFLTKALNRVIHVLRPKHPETINIAKLKSGVSDMHDAYMTIKSNPGLIKASVMYALIANLCELLTLYVVYVAFGEWVNIGAVIIAYGIANFAGLISVLPGGVGVYEVLMTSALAAGGIAAVLSIPVVATFRIVTMLIKLIPGWFLYSHALRRGRSG